MPRLSGKNRDLYFQIVESREPSLKLLAGTRNNAILTKEVAVYEKIIERKRTLLRFPEGADRRFGELTLLERRRRHQGTYLLVSCACGRTSEIRAHALLRRAKFGVGCMQVGCPVAPTAVRVWYDPEFALRLQITMLLSSQRDDVCQAWGGSALSHISIEARTESKAVEYFIASVKDFVRAEEGRWWIKRIDEDDAYHLYNIDLTPLPQWEVFRRSLDHINFGHQVLTLSEVAQMYHLPLERVREIRETHISDDACVSILEGVEPQLQQFDEQKFNSLLKQQGNDDDRRTVNYRDIAWSYNALEVGAAFSIPIPNTVLEKSIIASMSRYGLRRGLDYQLALTPRDANDDMAPVGKMFLSLFRLSTNAMRT